ncbi:bifunctional DNA primase/polymerase [Jongsikchunia kroppenstedtii]|uniref:bifunctional DNA primase/polymerase n=1 Tax=Jongsikchunia kroppenstedtii TaxID=1121721 RepID=UPI000370C346|nr:bifunctional DNA primase/polymerase [Jongsikchunia kroppenstedtii]
MAQYTGELLSAAIQYAESGWPVLPLQVGDKKPYGGFRWREEASTDPDLIRRWWADGKPHNIGIAVPRWYLVLDVDPRNGGNGTYYRLAAELGSLPDTWIAQTRDGGLHVWFRTDLPPEQIRGALGPGVDVKKSGGYVVAPPSRIEAETPGGTGQYRWLDSGEVGILPARWVTAVRRPVRPTRATLPAAGPAEVRALARWWCSVLRHTPEGNRNHQLFVSAVRLAERHCLTAEVERELADAAQQVGLQDHEIEATIRSAKEEACG